MPGPKRLNKMSRARVNAARTVRIGTHTLLPFTRGVNVAVRRARFFIRGLR
jgi:hypothetical protein